MSCTRTATSLLAAVLVSLLATLPGIPLAIAPLTPVLA